MDFNDNLISEKNISIEFQSKVSINEQRPKKEENNAKFESNEEIKKIINNNSKLNKNIII